MTLALVRGGAAKLVQVAGSEIRINAWCSTCKAMKWCSIIDLKQTFLNAACSECKEAFLVKKDGPTALGTLFTPMAKKAFEYHKEAVWKILEQRCAELVRKRDQASKKTTRRISGRAKAMHPVKAH